MVGLWWLVSGGWSLVVGLWWLVSGGWSLVDWCVVDWRVVDWRVVDWRVVDWRVVDWRVVDWRVVDWRVVDWCVVDWHGKDWSIIAASDRGRPKGNRARMRLESRLSDFHGSLVPPKTATSRAYSTKTVTHVPTKKCNHVIKTYPIIPNPGGVLRE